MLDETPGFFSSKQVSINLTKQKQTRTYFSSETGELQKKKSLRFVSFRKLTLKENSSKNLLILSSCDATWCLILMQLGQINSPPHTSHGQLSNKDSTTAGTWTNISTVPAYPKFYHVLPSYCRWISGCQQTLIGILLHLNKLFNMLSLLSIKHSKKKAVLGK